MHSLFGLELPTPVNFIVAFMVVLALIGAAAWAVRKFGAQRLEAATRGRQPRLAVIDSASVDNRRKLVIIRRDNVEHLLMIGGATDVVVETNIVRAAATRDAPAVREVPAARASAVEMPRAMPLPDPTPWPLQPEPALAPVPARTERVRAIEEPAPVAAPTTWPSAHAEPQVAPPVRPQRAPDTLTSLAADLARPAPEPVRAPAPQSAPVAAAPEPQISGDQNLAEMAQRLEAALRRPGQAAKPAAEAPVRPTPAAEAKRIEQPKAPRAEPKAQPAAAQQAAAAPAKTGFDSLEQEMASLLGRPGKT